MIKTFAGGVHPAALKARTLDEPIRKAPLPKKAVIPLIQHTGSPCRPLVGAGDYVRTGQAIAGSDKFISSAIHASVSGSVKSVGPSSHPVLGRYDAITIESDGKDEPHPSMQDRISPDGLSADEMRKIIRDAGIVGLGGAAFPAHVKLSPPKEKRITAVVLNGAECEPYLTCDHRLMLEKAPEILKGLGAILKITGAPYAYIGIETNKTDAASAFDKALQRSPQPAGKAKIVLLKTKYPQGAEKSLIKSVLGREVPPGRLPFDVGCVVFNVGTAFAIYEALYDKKPLYERVVTVSGDCVNEPSNLLVRIGTPAVELAEACGGLRKDPHKIIFGGPMTGITQYTLDVPVIKGTSGVLFLGEETLALEKEGCCIRCGGCVRVCPMGLAPTNIYYAAARGRMDLAKAHNAADCVECGACSYDCPAKLDLVGMIKYAKAAIAKD